MHIEFRILNFREGSKVSAQSYIPKLSQVSQWNEGMSKHSTEVPGRYKFDYRTIWFQKCIELSKSTPATAVSNVRSVDIVKISFQRHKWPKKQKKQLQTLFSGTDSLWVFFVEALAPEISL